jgi:hypothetical protein
MCGTSLYNYTTRFPIADTFLGGVLVLCSILSSYVFLFFTSSLVRNLQFPKSWSNTALSFLFHRPIDPVAACTTRIGRLNPQPLHSRSHNQFTDKATKAD